MSEPAREIEFKITGDGSHTLHLPALKENYHSWHGALTESEYVFIAQGLRQKLGENSTTYVFEAGFGTGLNAMLSLLEMQSGKSGPVHYTTIEKHPLPPEIYMRLNFPTFLGEEHADEFIRLHRCEWNKTHEIIPGFYFTKLQHSLPNYKPDKHFDIIYFDAFAPEKQPEMWTEEIFRTMFECLNPGGILVSYCAKGSFKRLLKACGFSVETLPGPPGKREMTRGKKPG